MKKIGLLRLVLVFFLMAGIGHAAMITAIVDKTEVMAGETFTVTVIGEGFGADQGGSIGTRGGDTILVFNGTAFEALQIDSTWPGSIKDTELGDQIGFGFASLRAGMGPTEEAAGPDFGLFTVLVRVRTGDGPLVAPPGTYDLTLLAGNWLNGSSFTTELLDPQPDAIGTSINIVPIPSAILLLGGGLIGLLGLRRRSKS